MSKVCEAHQPAFGYDQIPLGKAVGHKMMLIVYHVPTYTIFLVFEMPKIDSSLKVYLTKEKWRFDLFLFRVLEPLSAGATLACVVCLIPTLYILMWD